MAKDDRWQTFGDFIKAQRRLHEMSLRQLAEVAKVSNPYLSQLERGIHRPSVDVLKNLATALKVSTETLFAQAGIFNDESKTTPADVEAAIRLDPSLSTEQKEALIGVYRGFRGASASAPRPGRPRRSGAAPANTAARTAGKPASTRTRRASSQASPRAPRTPAPPPPAAEPPTAGRTRRAPARKRS